MKLYDCIVIGAGGVGSAALYYLARRGTRVLGLDRFPPGHDSGSAHRDTRTNSTTYFEHHRLCPSTPAVAAQMTDNSTKPRGGGAWGQ